MPSVSEVASVEEAAALLRDASAAGRSVSIEREGGDVVLSTRRLDRVLEHEAGDLTCIVEAGVRLSALQDVLEPLGQWLPLDPAADPTLGACLAGDRSGPRRHRYGTMRDLVIGATLVLGDGTIASSGGKVVKNVAGYDLAKLFCGSHGRLGLVARVALRLYPRPGAEAHLVVRCSSLEDACATSSAILRSGLVPSALELFWPRCDVAVMFEGGGRAVAAQLAAARELVGGEEDDGSVWAAARDARLRAPGRLAVAPAEIAAGVARFDEAVVSVAAGVAYVSEPVAASPDPVEAALSERVRRAFDPQGILV